MNGFWGPSFAILFHLFHSTLSAPPPIPNNAVGLLIPATDDYGLGLPPDFNLTDYNTNSKNALVDPYTYAIPSTNTSIKFSSYGARLSGPNATLCIDNAYNHARHHPAEKLLKYYYVWYPSGNVALSLTPQPGKGMTYGMFVEMTRGLRWFVVQQGMNVEVKYEVYEDFVGLEHVLVGKGEMGFWKKGMRPPGCPEGSLQCLLASTPGTAVS